MLRLTRLAVCLTGLSALTAQAQTLPALYDVSGVAPDDVLNIRSAPDPGAAIIGSLAPDATGVEVTELSGQWGRVNTAEQSGWVSLSFMTGQPGGTFPETQRLRCFGTEPFWSADITQNGPAEYRFFDGDPVAYHAASLMPGANIPNRFGLIAEGPDGAMALAIRREACNDGMSDRAYGLSVDVVIGGLNAASLAGCCSIAAQP